jgi:hypothetical protein
VKIDKAEVKGIVITSGKEPEWVDACLDRERDVELLLDFTVQCGKDILFSFQGFYGNMGRPPLVAKSLFLPVNDQIYETIVFQMIVD